MRFAPACPTRAFRAGSGTWSSVTSLLELSRPSELAADPADPVAASRHARTTRPLTDTIPSFPESTRGLRSDSTDSRRSRSVLGGRVVDVLAAVSGEGEARERLRDAAGEVGRLLLRHDADGEELDGVVEVVDEL